MINRRHFLEMSSGVLVLPATGLGALATVGEPADRLIVYNAEYADCRRFAREALGAGGTAVALSGDIGLRERMELYRTLLETPRTVLGMTTDENAFRIGMLARDAFHEQLVHETAGQRPVSWLVTPVRERAG